MFCILALFTVLVPVNGSPSLPHGVLRFRAPLSPLCGFSACGFNGKRLHGLVGYQVFLIGPIISEVYVPNVSDILKSENHSFSTAFILNHTHQFRVVYRGHLEQRQS